MRFRRVLLALMLLILALPFAPSGIKTMLALFGGIVPITGGSLGMRGRGLPALAVLCVCLSIHSLAGFNMVPEWLAMGILVAYFATASVLLLHQVFLSRAANSEVLSGALSSYLMLGLAWTSAFAMLVHLDPHSLRATDPLDMTSLFYFTFVTLLTVGYGDIVPVTSAARLMTVLTGLTGMIFTTVVLASLVSLRSSGRAEN